MRLWIVTNLRARPGQPLAASAIQNLMTAAALAEAGANVTLWVAGWPQGTNEALAEYFGRSWPAGLRFLTFRPHGAPGQKKTPFATPIRRAVSLLRGRAAGPWPHAVISRSPLLLEQLRGARILPAATRRVLEFQYPEWALLWRGWRRRHGAAPVSRCVARLRELRARDDAWLLGVDGVLYAARGHEPLLRRINYQGPSEFLPSGCLPPAPDLAPLPALAQSVPAQPPFDLGYVGGLARENGLDGLLAALAELPEATLRVVGGGTTARRRELFHLAGALGVADRATFEEAVPFAQVRDVMRSCRVGVVPISARCGPEKRQWASPLKLIEWLAAGVPVVAAAVPSVRQHVEDGREALLCPPDQPRALAAALQRLLDDQMLCARLAREGRLLAERSAYSCRADRILKFIERLGVG